MSNKNWKVVKFWEPTWPIFTGPVTDFNPHWPSFELIAVGPFSLKIIYYSFLWQTTFWWRFAMLLSCPELSRCLITSIWGWLLVVSLSIDVTAVNFNTHDCYNYDSWASLVKVAREAVPTTTVTGTMKDTTTYKLYCYINYVQLPHQLQLEVVLGRAESVH